LKENVGAGQWKRKDVKEDLKRLSLRIEMRKEGKEHNKELRIGMRWVGKRNAGAEDLNEVGRKGGMLDLRHVMRWVGKEECWS
jgi:hypothetical protein